MPVLSTSLHYKNKYSLARIILVFLFFISIVHTVSAQAPGMLEFVGKTTKNGFPLVGATVTIFRNETTQQEQLKTGKNGKFRLFLMFGYSYKITFTYPGCVDMHLMVYANSLKKERNDIFPLYETEIPFFDRSYVGVNLDKYKNPITKVIYDGKKAFKDDEAYLAEFMKDLLVSPENQAKALAEREAREREEREKLAAEIKTKNEAAERVRKEEAEKLLAAENAKKEAFFKAVELAKLKEEMARREEELAKAKPVTDESMETEAIRLQKEKERKDLLASKNREIKTTYQNDILKLVAENERREKQKAFTHQKQVAKANSVINQMRKEAELLAKSEQLNNELKIKQKKELENKQYKSVEIKKLIEAAAFAEKSVKISNQKTLPDVKQYQRTKLPNVLVQLDEGVFKTIRTTTIINGKKVDVYRKEYYLWSNTNYYKNDVVIDETTYNVEIAFFSSYKR